MIFYLNPIIIENFRPSREGEYPTKLYDLLHNAISYLKISDFKGEGGGCRIKAFV